jgi:hypothetical protein
MKFGQYSIFTKSGRFYLLQKIKQTLKKGICLIKGHDTTERVTSSGWKKARVVSFRNGKVLYRCNRCWKHVSRQQDKQNHPTLPE